MQDVLEEYCQRFSDHLSTASVHSSTTSTSKVSPTAHQGQRTAAEMTMNGENHIVNTFRTMVNALVTTGIMFRLLADATNIKIVIR